MTHCKLLAIKPALIAFLILLALPLSAQEQAKAYFAGGCFWCVEAAYQELDGVTDAVSGFIGGTLKNPTYKGNHKGHYEAVEVTYNPAIISYQQLLDVFWVNIDPFDAKGQFCDKGPSYRSALFVNDAKERELAEASKTKVQQEFAGDTVATVILPANKFYPVEEGHQDYYLKNPIRYKFYRTGCGRDRRLQQIWGERVKH
ncbi:MAG: peptide-methionine (S)-S-oxide reductase MsrA [Pseudomonadales bacterium]